MPNLPCTKRPPTDKPPNKNATGTEPNGFPCEWTGDYGVTSALIDAIVRGSLGRPFPVVWANGNERTGGYPYRGRCGWNFATTSPPACAKNSIQGEWFTGLFWCGNSKGLGDYESTIN